MGPGPQGCPHGGWACEHSMLGRGSGAVARPRCLRSACRAGVQLTSAFPRASSNAWVREAVALELSCVNSSLQLLKEELEELNGSSVEADQPERCVYVRARTPAGPRGACVHVYVCACGPWDPGRRLSECTRVRTPSRHPCAVGCVCVQDACQSRRRGGYVELGK